MPDNKLCTGCGVCGLLCPTGCIQMVENSEGFFYPQVDKNKCVGCGKCEQCHLNTSVKNGAREAYAVISLNEADIRRSSSGGLFSILARHFLKNGGLVVGCELSGADVRHIIIDSESELYRLQGSKYVESEISEVLPQIKEQLKQEKRILFSGTGCQTAAAKSYLGDSENITYFEILCHGVPSRSLFKKHVEYTEDKYGEKLKTVRFRSKEKAAWGMNYRFEYEFESGKRVLLPSCEDVFYTNYIKGTVMRESCYGCKYAGAERIGDITAGDYWGVEKHHKDISTKNGVSFVCVNTDKGKQLFDACRGEMTIYPTDMSYAQQSLHTLVSPLSRPAQRDTVYAEINENGYKKWNQSYHRSSAYIKEKGKYAIKRILPKSLRSKAAGIYHKVKKNNDWREGK